MLNTMLNTLTGGLPNVAIGPFGIDAKPLHDVQNSPVLLGPADDPGSAKLKIDAAYRFDKTVIVAGWCTGKRELGLSVDGLALEVQRVELARPDVAAHFLAVSSEGLGFVLVATAPPADEVSLTWESIEDDFDGQSRTLRFSTEAPSSSNQLHVLGPAMGLLALSYEPHSLAWSKVIAKAPASGDACRNARGFLEACSASELSREAVVVGWVVHTGGAVVWLEDERGRTHSLEGAFRRFRQDVHAAVGNEFGHASRDAGFVLRLRGLRPGATLKLKAVSETGVHVLSTVSCLPLPVEPVAAARFLFSIGTPTPDLYRRVPLVDEPLLGPLIQHRQTIWDELPVTRRQLGSAVAQPKVSVVVPLYGRTDFVEHQLIEFSKDPWFRAHAELIYVVDDPSLIESFPAQAESLHRLYQLPFLWVWGSANRGFSGANNLGAAQSRAPLLVFLNSDAFPQKPGWLQALTQVLDRRLDIGAVGPRLVFADGSIQHAGMQFMRREELGIWANHHANMGLDPALDPHSELTIVPAVTGACLAMRRADLEKLGGWDAGYLIGDFEDSDLCLQLRAAGLKIAYLPTVQLTHLERQSFKLLGQDDFRNRVVIYNAVRHQQRWEQLISAADTPAQPAQAAR